MKKLLSLILVFYVLNATAQQAQYLTVDFTPESTPGACDAELHINTSLLKQPVQAFYNTANGRVGNETDIYGLCSGDYVGIDIKDSACVRVRFNFYISPDPAYQVMLDTIMTILPSSVGASDGTISYSFDATLTPLFYRFESTEGTTFSYDTSGTAFGGLEENFYQFIAWDTVPGGMMAPVEHLLVDVYFKSTLPAPCDHSYDMNVYVNPASPGLCDGAITLIPTVGTATDYGITMTGYGSPGYPYINSTDGGFTFDNYAINVCPQPVVVEASENTGSNSWWYFNRVYFLGVDSSGTFSWSPPGTISGADTIVLSATYNCMLDYSLPPDTVYIDTIHYIGANTYGFTLVLEQDTIITETYGTVFADTTGSFFIDFTLYCPDTLLLRSGVTEYQSMRNLVYFGDVVTGQYDSPSSFMPVKLYPNPAQSTITVEISNQLLKSVEVYTLAGDLFYSLNMQLSRTELNVTGWNSAVYMLKYTTLQGETGFLRFIKL